VLFFKISSGMHSDPKFGQRGGGVSYNDARNKGSGMPSGLRPSEKELPERHSGMFHHKNMPVYNLFC
jgi:hypothetical protein